MNDIMELTYPAYKEIVAGVSRSINWEVQLSVVGLSGEIDSNLNPLYAEEEEEKVFRMSDAMALQQMANN